MARLIVKSPYLKGGGRGGYVRYIGTRDGVELLPSGYVEYMAGRPRSHGLFGDEEDINLEKAIAEVNEYPGNIWTHIISLKREDAARLGFDHARQWRNLLLAHRNDIAAAMHIPPKDFRWYAAFHDEGDHPHVHMMAWSARPGQAYLSREGIRTIKSVLVNDIFKQEMLHTYEQKSASRDELIKESRRAMRELIRQMREGVCDCPAAEEKMDALVSQLESVTGKKKYGYLPKRVKKAVDEIVDELERLPVVDRCYQTWWDLQCEIEDYYSEQDRQRPPLSERKEFRAIKNAVIQEAENIRLGTFTFEDRDQRDESDGEEYAAYRLGKMYLAGKEVTKDVERAVEYLTASAEAGNQYAQYVLGKLYLMGQEVPQDREEARYWLTVSAAQGNEYARFFLDRWDSMGKPSVMLSVVRLLHQLSRVFRDNVQPRDAASMIQNIDRKLRQRIREKKIAMGHKLDDHEEYQGPTMSM